MEKQKRKTKNSIVVIIILMIMIICKVKFCKASSFSFNAQSDKTQVTPGEEVIIEMSLSNIDMSEHGINVVEGFLEYDKSFFSSMELVNENDWKITYNNETGERKGKFLTAKIIEGVKLEEIIGKIKLKVREDITEGEGKLKIKKIQSNDGKNLIDEGERIITIKIKKSDVSHEPNNPDVPQENGEDKEIDIPQSTTKYERLDNVDTGDNIIIVIGIILGVVIVNLVIVFLKIRNKEKNK